LSSDATVPAERRTPRLGWQAVSIVSAFYLVCLSIATWPRVLWLRSSLPERYDSLQHLWIMRWYRTCLLEGRLPLYCPEIQHPIGAPLGNFSSLHLQALLYVPLSLIIPNDALCYNVIWVIGLLVTGLGTFLLSWHLLGDRASAAVGGLLAMLCAPMMVHAHAHLELVHVGWFPLFLVAWMRFVDRPGRGRLALAALGYIAVAMSAAYFMVFAIFPAALYVAWRSWQSGFKAAGPWLWARSPWLLGFVVLVLPGLLVLFSGQFWALLHGYSLEYPRKAFDSYGAPLWSYLTPTPLHWLGALLSRDPYATLGKTARERVSYLGVVTVVLLAYGALRRVRFRNAGYVWSAFGLLVVLSMGSAAHVGSWTISLPSGWLWKAFPLFRMTRVPARFNLFVGVLAATLAAAGLSHLLARVRRRRVRFALCAGLAAVAVADLGMVPFSTEPIPAMPAAYAFVKQRDLAATLLEVPYLGSSGSYLNASCTYWQSLHRLTTSAGYSGHTNVLEDSRIGHNCPFEARRLGQPGYLEDPGHMNFDVTADVDFREFVWLYMVVNRFDYILLHQRAGSIPECSVRLDRLKVVLRECAIYEDEATVVYARARLRPPRRPVSIALEEWQERTFWRGRWNCRIPRSARVVLYNPDRDRDLTMILDTATAFQDQAVRVRAGARELARWDIANGDYHHCVSAPFHLPGGLQELTIESVNDSRSQEGAEYTTAARRPTKPHRLHIARFGLSSAQDPEQARPLSRTAAIPREY
jgi:hypothetical protein